MFMNWETQYHEDHWRVTENSENTYPGKKCGYSM